MKKEGDKLLQDLKDKAQKRDRIRKLAWILSRPFHERVVIEWLDYFDELEVAKLGEYKITAEVKDEC